MGFNENLELYAELIVNAGVNLQKGQMLVINCPTDCAYFGRLVAKYGFKREAKDVAIIWTDDDFSRIRYDNADIERYQKVPEWQAKMLNDYANDGACFVNIRSSDPTVFAGIDPKKPAEFSKAVERDCKDYRHKLNVDAVAWNIIAIPNTAWASKIFPDDKPETAVEKLWEAIFKATRVDTGNPLQAWEEHKQSFQKRINWLNELKLKEVRVQTDKGTDITVGMLDNFEWLGGGAKTTEGLYFFPNMPTEEIFTTPHKDKTNGKVHSALPLIYQGDRIDNFYFEYKDGKIVNYGAEVGYENLKSLVETDEGSLRLGELALVPNKSPISDMGILFYNTLYDENASCHLAVGTGFPSALIGGTEMNTEQLLENGVNYSATHVDFMIGTAKTTITGIDSNGKEVPIFIDGNFVNI